MDANEKRIELVAQRNMFVLGENPYPGRVVVVGMNDTGDHAVQICCIMGRSDNSRNRVYGVDNGRVFTEAVDTTKVKDGSLIFYNAMGEGVVRSGGKNFAVSNGEQTDKIATDGMGILFKYWYEPDPPNFTPRISGLCGIRETEHFFELAILRKSPWGDVCDRHFYTYDNIGNGYGYCLTTYTGDGDPLPSFCGEPLLMPITGDVNAVAEAYWNALNEQNRVALVVKYIPLRGGPQLIKIVNKFSKV